MRARRATCTEDDIKLLKTRVVTSSDNTYPADALHVFKTNKEVDNNNLSHIKKSQSHIHEIKAIDKRKDIHTGQLTVVMPSKASDTGGLREVLVVTMGARVMVTVNINVSDDLANGVCGTVVGIETTGDQVIVIFVKFDSPRVRKDAIARSQYRQQYPDAVPIMRQEVQFFTGRGRHSVEARRTQFPLTLAWACTIHKVQGKTLEQVVVAMKGKVKFMPGQAYVAIHSTGVHRNRPPHPRKDNEHCDCVQASITGS
ncbi:ATP-dependent DNA helicase PIF1 [Liparis tanakae]|uniref:ATP-dependent DNA helicase PIF1 n=1 Tax=Liparis tanakae TaxID=230148 RepID=A0A4Z2E2F9_9TELE|nr:ATP-dependent DNA helicase PIF1 [Liparis tanakae]